MNTDILDKPIVLSLNRAWQVIGHRTVKQAIIALNGGSSGLPPALGVDVAYPKLEDGSWNFDPPRRNRSRPLRLCAKRSIRTGGTSSISDHPQRGANNAALRILHQEIFLTLMNHPRGDPGHHDSRTFNFYADLARRYSQCRRSG